VVDDISDGLISLYFDMCSCIAFAICTHSFVCSYASAKLMLIMMMSICLALSVLLTDNHTLVYGYINVSLRLCICTWLVHIGISF
jgi:hypothetical protein